MTKHVVLDQSAAEATAPTLNEIVAEIRELRKQLAAATDRSVSGFCRRWDLSRYTFYNLMASDEAPDTMRVGGRRLISAEAEARWVLQREAAAKNAAGPIRVVGKRRSQHEATPD